MTPLGTDPPKISVVVPTHDRFEAVSRLLTSLGRQTINRAEFEVLVVADGCRDGTAGKLRAAEWPFHLVVLEQPQSGAATARNRGADEAAGDVLLFLDDDVEPEPGLLGAHLVAHAGDDPTVALGSLEPAVAHDGFFGVVLRGWLEEMAQPVREHGRRHTCFDLLSGHFSIPRQTFKTVGGFDSALRCREDYELGYRINAAGIRFQLLQGAGAKHHDTTDLAKAIRRKFDEGIADVAICDRHPALAHALPLRCQPQGSRMTPVLYWLAWRHPRLGDALASCVTWMLPAYEFWRLRYRWRMRVEDLLSYWYWRGIATAAGSLDRLSALRAAPKTGAPCATIDLGAGVETAQAQLDRIRPVSVRFVYGTHLVGELPETPGAEPIRGMHLRRIIARQFRDEYLRAVYLSGAVPEFLLNPALEHRLLHPPDSDVER